MYSIIRSCLFVYARTRKMTDSLIGLKEGCCFSPPSSSVSVGLCSGRQHERLHLQMALHCLFIAEDLRSYNLLASSGNEKCPHMGGTLLYVALKSLIIIVIYVVKYFNALIQHVFPF